MKNIIRKNLLLTAACGLLITLSCNSNNTNTTSNQDSIASSNISETIAITPLTHAKEFPGATLTISSLASEKLGNDSAKITIKYAVQNFNLTEQTAHDHHMANSADGQHIHFILDNQPYVALYKPEHTFNVPLNSEHYVLSFLSRSFHESIKTTDASKLIKFNVNADGQIEEEAVPTEPSLFYSRPKGEYKGEDTKDILLDFFLVNTDLSSNGNKVKATINGEDFILDQWVPYQITNLPKGELNIKLSLVDKEGNVVSGDNVSVERKSSLLE